MVKEIQWQVSFSGREGREGTGYWPCSMGLHVLQWRNIASESMLPATALGSALGAPQTHGVIRRESIWGEQRREVVIVRFNVPGMLTLRSELRSAGSGIII